MSKLDIKEDSRVIVSLQDNEDGIVLKNPEGMELIQTLDFFTPIVNNPYYFGQIAAANAMSDVYAMGGEPYSAMNIVCFPTKEMDLNILIEILKGGYSKVLEAGAVLAGGHSVEDKEIKYGLAVTGIVRKEHIATNNGAKVGDFLVLTKPLGTGILATALKAKWEGYKEIEELVYFWASRLNKVAAEVIRKFNIKGATDITGFGLGGHLFEMAKASCVQINVWSKKIPILDRVIELTQIGLVPEGSHANRRFCEKMVKFSSDVDPILIDIIFDAQTSGGMVLCVPEERMDEVCSYLIENGDMGAVIGKVEPFRGDIFLNIV